MAAPAQRTLRVEIPSKLGFLMDMHRYKIAYGGRGGAKSHSFGRALLALGAAQPLRIVCGREVQKSTKESVYQLLVDLIGEMKAHGFYRVMETEIVGRNGTTIGFVGLAGHTVESIKSLESVDIFWVEEAQSVSKRSWDILIPTIRAENSEIWASFNPNMEEDEVYQMFVIDPPANAQVVKMTYADNPWFPEVLEIERNRAKARMSADDYNNIWEGFPRRVVEGAIYAREVNEAQDGGRIRPMPYDPRLPVHTVWDLGWNDAMTILMVQKPVPSVVNVINYREDNFRRYDEFVQELNGLGYRWGTDFLPHDGANENPQTGMSTKRLLQNLGRRDVRTLPQDDKEDGIKRARMMFPRVYFDTTKREIGTGYLGAARLLSCLKRYRRTVPKTTGEPATPVHDEYSHGADAFRYLSLCVDQMTNESDTAPVEYLPAYEPLDAGMGALG